jgi:spore germination cell wall hydrolase CwlJ-like protein
MPKRKIKIISITLAILLIPVRLSASEEVNCMAEAVYYEARGQSQLGQLAVAIVIRNRMKDPRWPSTACEVVKDGRYWNGHPVRDMCQFSYWCDGKPERPAEKQAWKEAVNIAELVYGHDIEVEDLKKATHYHALSVRPFWADKLILCLQIGDHRFYY